MTILKPISFASVCRWFASRLFLVLHCLVGCWAASPPDRLTLLVPDGADRLGWPIRVWVDSAAEEGIGLEVVSDSTFIAWGADARQRIAGLVVPDSAHQRASDAVIAAIKWDPLESTCRHASLSIL